MLDLWKKADATPSVTDSSKDIEALIKRDNAAFLVAEIEGQIVGSIIGTFDGWRGHIYRLAVDPRHRRKGLAGKLVSSLEQLFKDWGARRVIAIVETKHPWAMGFWSSAGYVNDSMTRFFKNM